MDLLMAGGMEEHTVLVPVAAAFGPPRDVMAVESN